MTPTTQQIIHGIASLNAALTHALTGEWEACARDLAAAAGHAGVELYAAACSEESVRSVRTPIIWALGDLDDAARWGVDQMAVVRRQISVAFTRAWLMSEPEIASGRATAKAA